MKKLSWLIMAALAAGTTVVCAQTSQELDSIIGSPLHLKLRARLSDGTHATEADLGGNLSMATVELLNINPLDGDTNCIRTLTVIGSSLSTSNFVDTTFDLTNTVISGVLLAETGEVPLRNGKTIAVFGQEAAIIHGTRALRCGSCDPIPGFAVPEDVLTNSIWTVLSKEHTSGVRTTFLGQVIGIWKDGSTGFKGILKNTR